MQTNLCFNCQNYGGDLKCLAFPDGIPEEILTAEIAHTKPIKEQSNKITFIAL